MPLPENPTLLARNMSYVKPLNASIGPKSTKCELRDETVHCDFDDYVSTLTTTRTPEVPSGNVFSVKTRTCIMWASNVSTKVIVTSQVEWTGRSFIKGKLSLRPSLAKYLSHRRACRNRRAVGYRWPEDVPQGTRDGDA